MRRLLFTAAILAILVGWNPQAGAHHSSSWFDMTREISVVGQITRVEWINPHILVFVEGKETWVLQGFPPNVATRSGISKEKLQSGVLITAQVYVPSGHLTLDKNQAVIQTSSTASSSTMIVEAGQIRLPNGEVLNLGRGPGFKAPR